ncbi:MAG: sulfotransferase [Parvularculaceae bacterium]|nr:sulfotransferase [Parvularculaceae bacterium]
MATGPDFFAHWERMAPVGADRASFAEFLSVLRRTPDLPDLWYEFARMLKAKGHYELALAAYEEALARGADRPEEIHLNRGVIFADHLRRETDAEAELKEAIAHNPDYAPAWLNLGNLREEVGDKSGAIECYNRILPPTDETEAPHIDCRHEALARLWQLVPPNSLADPFLGRLEAAARSKRLLPPETRANLFYALGRSLDALRAYDRAFAAYAEANRFARKAGPPYDRAAIVAEVDRLIEAFPTAARRGAGSDGAPEPVFICGMFRSGSTLVEQVLAAHPAVTAGGELNLLNRITEADLAPFPQSIRLLSDAKAERLAANYRRDLVRLFPASAAPGSIVTDKRPDNFLRIGLIKRLFPGAKIIHTVRHPVDTCLSVFFQHIDQTIVGYASDLADCGRYYSQYRRLMAHWKSVYSTDIFDFDYDRFVDEPRAQIQSLLEFLGLPWAERCLEFHTLKNPVKTASYWQVRRPLYRDSSGRRRHYEAHLGPLIGELESAGIEID